MYQPPMGLSMRKEPWGLRNPRAQSFPYLGHRHMVFWCAAVNRFGLRVNLYLGIALRLDLGMQTSAGL